MNLRNLSTELMNSNLNKRALNSKKHQKFYVESFKMESGSTKIIREYMTVRTELIYFFPWGICMEGSHGEIKTFTYKILAIKNVSVWGN